MLHDIPDGDDETRLHRAFLLTLGREPSAKEFAVLRGYFSKLSADLNHDTNAAKSLLNSALEQAPVTPATAAALVCAARTLFNTDNFITRE